MGGENKNSTRGFSGVPNILVFGSIFAYVPFAHSGINLSINPVARKVNAAFQAPGHLHRQYSISTSG